MIDVILILLIALAVGALGMFGGMTAAYLLAVKRQSLTAARHVLILFAWPVFVVLGAFMIASDWVESYRDTDLPETQIIGGEVNE